MDIAVRDDRGATELPVAPAPVAPSPLDRRRRLVLISAVTAAVVSTSGLVASAFVKSPAQVAADTAPPKASVLTAAVEQRILKSTLVLRGTVAPGFSIPVTPASSSTTTRLVVTALRAQAGAQLSAGDVLIEVSGRPIIALPGAVPAYRDLKPGDEGRDITELQEALRALGLPPGQDQVGLFGAGTKSAVRALYNRLGYDVPVTGSSQDVGDRKALRAAEDAVTGATRQRDAARSALTAAQQRPGAADAVAAARVALTAAQQDLDRAEQDRAELIARTGPLLPLSEFVFVPTFPVRVATLSAKVGDQVSAALLTIEGGRLVVQARLQTSDGALVKAGMPATVDSEVLGASTTGHVEVIGALTAATQAQPAGGNQQNSGGQNTAGSDTSVPGYPITVNPDDPLAANWSGQNVRLTIEAAATAGPVLVVPLAAVSAGADGATTVTRVDPDGTHRRVSVRAGVSGGGYVQVDPADAAALKASDRVVVGQ